jgi:xylulokinase
MEYILAHDVGTSGCKTVLFNLGATAGKQVVATAYVTYPTYYPQPSYAEQDVEDWWKGVVKGTRGVLEKSDARPEQVLAISFSFQMLNTIPVDKTGTPLRTCISWLDGRAWEEAGQVMRMLGGPSLFNMLVGAVISGKDLIPKYLWLKRHEPEIYKKAVAILDCGSYMLHRTTGRLVYEWSVASVTGLFNLKSKTWDNTLIRLFGLDEAKFPELVRSIDKVGGLLPEAAQQMGLLEGTPVYGGAGDGMCTAVGSGAAGDGDAHIALGTSGYIGVTTSRKVTGRQGIATLQSADPTRLLLIAEGETVGASLKWAVKELYSLEPGGEAYAHMDAQVEQVSPGSGSLIFTPWLYGERCPVPDESVRAAFINLGANHSRDQMARSVYEGVAYNFCWILDLINERHGFECQMLRAVGGGARGEPWLRILADVTGRTMEKTPYDQEAAAVGAALIAAIGAGVCPSFDAVKSFVPVLKSFQADASLQETYQPLYQAYRKVYPALKEIYHSLNRAE